MNEIVTYNDERLAAISEHISNIDDEILKMIDHMFKMMHAYNGIGLAGVQIGYMKNLFVTNVPGNKRYAMINPKIVEFSQKKSIYEEGCLSVPGISAEVERPASVTIQYTDKNGKDKVLKARGLQATCLQHEFDHLQGIIFIDRLPPEIKMQKIREYKRINKQ